MEETSDRDEREKLPLTGPCYIVLGLVLAVRRRRCGVSPGAEVFGQERPPMSLARTSPTPTSPR